MNKLMSLFGNILTIFKYYYLFCSNTFEAQFFFCGHHNILCHITIVVHIMLPSTEQHKHICV